MSAVPPFIPNWPTDFSSTTHPLLQEKTWNGQQRFDNEQRPLASKEDSDENRILTAYSCVHTAHYSFVILLVSTDCFGSTQRFLAFYISYDDNYYIKAQAMAL